MGPEPPNEGIPVGNRNIRGDHDRKAFRVINSRSKVKLRWQSGNETEEWSTDLVPYRHVDE
jgi:hypothetical protein